MENHTDIKTSEEGAGGGMDSRMGGLVYPQEEGRLFSQDEGMPSLNKGNTEFPGKGYEGKGQGGYRTPSIKLDAILRNFDGSQHFDEWFTKFKLVARYSDWTDERTCVAMLVLRLEGSALMVFEQMPDYQQDSFEAIVAKLKAAFMPSAAEAHQNLISRKYIVGEAPERLWSDLLRLWKMSTGQYDMSEAVIFSTIKPFFLGAIPKQAALQIKLTGCSSLDDLMMKTKMVLAECAPSGVLGALGFRRPAQGSKKKFACFRCGSTDHKISECKQPATCFKCKKPGHMSKDCKDPGKVLPVVGAMTSIQQPYPLTVAKVYGRTGPKQVVAAVDTMACVSLIESKLARELQLPVARADVQIQAVTGNVLPVLGEVSVEIQINESKRTILPFLVVENMPLCPLLLGLTAHPHLGESILIDCTTGMPSYVGNPLVGAVSSGTHARIENRDFTVWRETSSNGVDFKWCFEWKFKDNTVIPDNSQVSCPNRYEKSWFNERTEECFDKEVARWIEDGILVEETEGGPGVQLPWNLVNQPNKPTTPVRLALDYRTLNDYLRCETQDSLNEVCSDELRRWRGYSGGDLLDISRAYLQVGLRADLQRFQRAVYKGKLYKATRLMFGINIGCKVLHVILKEILKEFLDADQIGLYRDDILVYEQPDRERIRERVTEVLRANGFHLKPPTPLEEGANLLGLTVRKEKGHLVWERKESIEEKYEEVPDLQTCRHVASWIASLVAKYPVQGFLRMYGSLIQSTVGCEVASASGNWDVQMSPDLYQMVVECATLLRGKGDPCRGSWHVDYNSPMHLYTDASLQFEAAVLLSNGNVIEDWASVVDEPVHGNYHELEAVRKGLEIWYSYIRLVPNANRTLVIHTDSTTVVNWVETVMQDKHFKISKSLFGVSVYNRLKSIKMLLAESRADATIVHVAGTENLADCLTRRIRGLKLVGALHPWCGWELSKQVLGSPPVVQPEEVPKFIETIHYEMGHSGVEASLATIRSSFELSDWKGFAKAYKAYHESCGVCRVKSAKPFKYESGGAATQAVAFNEELFIDFLHLGSEQLDPVKGVIVLLDGFSRFVRIFGIVSDKPSGRDVANAIASWVADFGSPKSVRVDQGRENYNQLVFDYCALWGIQVRYGPSGHPQAQSLVERFNGTLLRLLRSLQEANENAAVRLERARYIYLRRVQKGIGCSPIAMITGSITDPAPPQVDSVSEPRRCPVAVGEKVLWKRINHPKDSFGWLEDEVTEVLGPRTVRLRSGRVSSVDRLKKL
jgi:hypothetical protein